MYNIERKSRNNLDHMIFHVARAIYATKPDLRETGINIVAHVSPTSYGQGIETISFDEALSVQSPSITECILAAEAAIDAFLELSIAENNQFQEAPM